MLRTVANVVGLTTNCSWISKASPLLLVLEIMGKTCKSISPLMAGMLNHKLRSTKHLIHHPMFHLNIIITGYPTNHLRTRCSVSTPHRCSTMVHLVS